MTREQTIDEAVRRVGVWDAHWYLCSRHGDGAFLFPLEAKETAREVRAEYRRIAEDNAA